MINRRKRRDGNHATVKAAFERLGWSVIDTSQLGGSVPDLLCARSGRVVAIEVKAAKGRPSVGQAAWLAAWPAETAIVRTYEDVVAVTNRWTPTGEFDTPTLGDA